MHNKFMRRGLGLVFAWNSSLWRADQAQRAQICQSKGEWCWPPWQDRMGMWLALGWWANNISACYAQSFKIKSIQLIFGYMCEWGLPWKNIVPHWHCDFWGSCFLPSSHIPFPACLRWEEGLERGMQVCLPHVVSSLLANWKERGRNLEASPAECLSRVCQPKTAATWWLGSSDRGQRGPGNKERKSLWCDLWCWLAWPQWLCLKATPMTSDHEVFPLWSNKSCRNEFWFACGPRVFVS